MMPEDVDPKIRKMHQKKLSALTKKLNGLLREIEGDLGLDKQSLQYYLAMETLCVMMGPTHEGVIIEKTNRHLVYIDDTIDGAGGDW